MKIYTSITGIILAGGKSSRMKCDKAFLKLDSQTIIQGLVSRLKKRFSRLMIIANRIDKYMSSGASTLLSVNPECNRRVDADVKEDILPDRGPLGGIYTALVESDSFYNFVFACDTPFVNLDLVDYMINNAKGADIIVPEWNKRFEPLHAIYSKKCSISIERQLEKNDLKITNFFSEVNVKVIEQEKLEKFNSEQKLFMNINTREDYAIARQI